VHCRPICIRQAQKPLGETQAPSTAQCLAFLDLALATVSATLLSVCAPHHLHLAPQMSGFPLSTPEPWHLLFPSPESSHYLRSTLVGSEFAQDDLDQISASCKPLSAPGLQGWDCQHGQPMEYRSLEGATYPSWPHGGSAWRPFLHCLFFPFYCL
jgi:hypothetical protein